MNKQNINNYRKYYAPHHFIFLPLMTGLSITGFWHARYGTDHHLEWLLFGVVSFCILYLAIMLRQHYALGNQNRIVRLEFRLRYFELFNASSDQVEKKLTFGQIAALRFANKNEFKILLDKTLADNLTPDDIKRSITDWQADHMRV